MYIPKHHHCQDMHIHSCFYLASFLEEGEGFGESKGEGEGVRRDQWRKKGEGSRNDSGCACLDDGCVSLSLAWVCTVEYIEEM